MTTASDNYTRPSGAVGNVSDCRTRVASSIPARSHTLAEIDYEIISTAIILSPADLRRVVVSNKRKYVHEILVNHLVKL